MKAIEILKNLDLRLGTATRRDVITISRLADSGGTLQPEDMLALFPARPERHSTTSIRQALIWAGCSKEAR